MQSQEAQSGKKVITAYGKTLVGMSPIWLMGEALTGRKVGSQFRRGKGDLVAAAEELRGILTDSAKDILVVVDDKLRTQKDETVKTAEVLRSAGEDVIVVVTSSLLESKSQFEKNAPGLKHTVLKNSKDVVIILDKAIKHPIVVTGVTKFAKSKGIPRPEAILTLAALGIGKLVKIVEAAEADAKRELEILEEEARRAALAADRATTPGGGDSEIVVVDATEFEKNAPREETKAAEEIGKNAADPAPGQPSTSGESSMPGGLPDKGKGKAKEKKDDGCVMM